MHQVKILNKLHECAGWYEFSLGIHVQRYLFWHCGTFVFDRQHSFMEIDLEIFSAVILSLPLIQEGHLSVSWPHQVDWAVKPQLKQTFVFIVIYLIIVDVEKDRSSRSSTPVSTSSKSKQKGRIMHCTLILPQPIWSIYIYIKIIPLLQKKEEVGRQKGKKSWPTVAFLLVVKRQDDLLHSLYGTF